MVQLILLLFRVCKPKHMQVQFLSTLRSRHARLGNLNRTLNHVPHAQKLRAALFRGGPLFCFSDHDANRL